jgi:hypothetical protein
MREMSQLTKIIYDIRDLEYELRMLQQTLSTIEAYTTHGAVPDYDNNVTQLLQLIDNTLSMYKVLQFQLHQIGSMKAEIKL